MGEEGSRNKSVAQWQATLDVYTMPRLGNRPVDRIKTAGVMAVLLPIWNEKRETARRVRLRLSAIFKWSVAQGYRDDNPAGDAIGAATAHKLARLIYTMLRDGEEYVDAGAEYYEKQYQDRALRVAKRRAAQLGYQLVPLPDAPASGLHHGSEAAAA